MIGGFDVSEPSGLLEAFFDESGALARRQGLPGMDGLGREHAVRHRDENGPGGPKFFRDREEHRDRLREVLRREGADREVERLVFVGERRRGVEVMDQAVGESRVLSVGFAVTNAPIRP